MEKLMCKMMSFMFLSSLFISYLITAPAYSAEEASVKVLIVGAGPSGLSVAKALQNRGIYPDIIEKAEQICADGAGIAMPANGSWALNKLGIDISTKALRIQNMQFTDDQGEVLVIEKIDKIHPEGAQFYSLGRNELVQHLLSYLDKRIQIQTSTTIKHFSEENDQVNVEFSNGDVKTYDLVIGCDGVHSKLRSQVHPNEVSEFLNLLVWRSVIDAPLDVTMPTYMLGSDRLVFFYPMPNNQTYIYGQLFQSEKSLPLQSFLQVLSDFGGPAPMAVQAINQQNLTPQNVHFYIHHMERSHSVRFKLDGFSRVLLVGDAAHAFGPALQNGAAQAFEDAYVIQELIPEGMETNSVASFVDAFEKRRLARVQNIFTISNVIIQAISNPEQIRGRNDAIRKKGAPNVNGFKLLMQQNP